MNNQTSIPTSIIAGPQAATTQRAHEIIRQRFCTTQSPDCFCRTCRAIGAHQFHALMWINPAKDYTTADLEPLLMQVSFALDQQEQFFFVLEHAEKLTHATANRLLKILEEPPHGYHFLLLTSNVGALLPTIVSRSVMIRLADEHGGVQNPLLKFFATTPHEDQTAEFESCLQQQHLTDSESEEILAQLFDELEQQLRRNPDNELLSEQLAFLTTAMVMPPQSGSSALFWKFLWLHFPR